MEGCYPQVAKNGGDRICYKKGSRSGPKAGGQELRSLEMVQVLFM